jgi:DNA invertase Pin-like site-specific DNA recombinase
LGWETLTHSSDMPESQPGTKHHNSNSMPFEKPDASGSSRETASGARTDRPQLALALDYARPGDTLVVWRLDRLGRSLKHLIDTVGALEERGIGFRSIHENVDTTTSTGKLIFHVFGALAEFERDLIVDRTKAGLAAARQRGATPGRKPSLSADQVNVVRRMHSEGGHTVAQIAGVVGVSRATVYRCLAQPV